MFASIFVKTRISAEKGLIAPLETLRGFDPPSPAFMAQYCRKMMEKGERPFLKTLRKTSLGTYLVFGLFAIEFGPKDAGGQGPRVTF